jgi:hypothetical protein
VSAETCRPRQIPKFIGGMHELHLVVLQQ